MIRSKLLSGRQLTRAHAALREHAPVAGFGCLAKQTPQGVMLHQDTFRLGREKPTEGLTSEESLGWDVANSTPDVTPGYGGYGGRGMLPPAKQWPRGKLCIIGRRTARQFQDTARQSDASATFANFNPKACGLTVTKGFYDQKNYAAPLQRRRGADGARYPRADAARLLQNRTPPIGAGYGFERRSSASGTVISQARAFNHEVVGGLIATDGTSTLIDISSSPQILQAVDYGTVVTVNVRLFVIGIAGNGAFSHLPAFYEPRGLSICPVYILATLSRTGMTDQVVELKQVLPIPSGATLADPTTWAATGLDLTFSVDGTYVPGWGVTLNKLTYLA